MNKKHVFAAFSPIGLGIALGLTWGLGMLLSGWAAMFGWCTHLVASFSSIYVGYTPSFLGGMIGALWGFAHGFIKGVLIGYFYNLVTQKFSDSN